MLELKKTPLAIAVQGYKGGGNRTPVEAPNTLKSIALANILDLLSEGPIVGLVNGLKSVYLDETPVESPNGTRNFTNFQIDYRYGTPDQSYISGFDSVENEIAVGVELKYGAPFVRQFTNINLDAIRVRLSVPALHSTNKENGDISGTSVGYQLAVSTDNGPYITVETNGFNGKTMNKYERDHKITLPPATLGWSIRVTRTTPNSTVSELQNQTFVESMVEVIEAKLRYPNSAVVGVTLEATQFSNIPARAYDVKGRIIRVPTNYNPETRAYTGVWDGTFKLAWTDNPAWVYYDLATHPRYGLGHLITDLQINKWVLYSIAQYCDGLVPDGRGGSEPRFTCNLFLQKQADAYKVLQDLATVFRGIAYWANGEIQAIQDRPDEPVFLYSPANVIAGKFGYEGTARKTRFNVALVSWNDMNNMGRAAIEYVDDPEGIARYGIQQTDATAIGCTSQAQAQRVGRYLLATSKYETQSVTFQVGLDGTLVAPGKIILINDPLRAGERLGGRIASVAGNSSIIVDGEPGEIEIGDTLRVVLPDGTLESRVVSSIVGNQIIVSVAFTQTPQAESMWSAERTNVQALRYRVLSVTEEDGKIFTITAVRHVEGKFANADLNVRIDPPRESQMTPAAQAPVTDLMLTSYESASYVTTSHVITASWNAPKNAVEYEVEWKRDANEWVRMPNVVGTSVDIRDCWEGTYLVRVRAVNSNKILSQPVTSQPFNLGAMTTVPGVVGEIYEEVQENYTELLEKTTENALAIQNEAVARAQKDTQLAAADAAEAGLRANGDAANAQAIVDEATARQNAINSAVTNLEAQIAALDLGDILGAEDWVKTKSYLANTLVVSGGKLYRAKVNVPANIEITNATYWEPVGNYTELIDKVSAQAATISQHTSQITNINGQVSTLNTDVTQLKSRVTSAEGTLTSNSTAIGALQTNVTNLNNTVTANSSSITQLKSDMTDTKQGVATNAGAITGLTTRVSNAEGLITSQGQAITQVQAGLGNIGGDNLLIDSSFETSNNGASLLPSWQTSNTNNMTVSYSDSPLPGSTRFLSVSGTLVGSGQYVGVEPITSLRPKVIAGQKYVNSVWAKGTPGATLRMVTQFLTAGSASGLNTVTQDFILTDKFQRFVMNPVVAADNAAVGRAIYRIIGGATSATLQLDLDNAQFQQGEVATQWMPSGSELSAKQANTAAAVTSLTATVTQQGNNITSQGSAITSLTSTVGDLQASNNVIQNGSFTVDVADWFSSASGSTFSWDSTERALISGPGSIRVRSQGFVVNPGDKVSVAFKHKTSVGTTSTSADTVGLIADLSAPTSWISGTSTGAWAGGSAIAGVWTQRNYTWTIPNTIAPNTTVYLRFAVGTITPASGSMSLDDIVVTTSSSAAAQAKALQDVNTRVTSAEGTLTSQATAITNLQTAVGSKADSSTVVALTNRVTATEGSISTLNSSVTTLQSNINNIGGDNLFVNSSFEQRADDTTLATGWQGLNSVTATYSYSASPLPGSSVAMRVSGTATAGSSYIGCEPASANRATAVEGQRYTISGYLRGTAGRTLQMYLIYLGANDTEVGRYVKNDVITDTFARYQATAQAAPAGTLRVRACFRLNAGSTGAFWMEVDNAQLQLGEIATNWSPSVGEVTNTANASATAITSLTTRMTVAEGNVTSQGDSITKLDNRLTGVSATGENLLYNSNFATGLDWWQLNTPFPVWSATAGDGRPGVTMTKNNASNPAMIAHDGNYFPVMPTNGRRFRAVIRAMGVSGAMNVMLRLQRMNTITGATGSDDKTLTLTNEFANYSVDFNALDATIGAARLYVYCYPANAVIRVDKVELYDITDQLSGDANASALTALTTRVTAAEGSLTSTSQQITSLSNNVSVIQNGQNTMFPLGTFETYTDNQQVGFAATSTRYTAKSLAKKTGQLGMEINIEALGTSGNADLNLGSEIPVGSNRRLYIEYQARLRSGTPTSGTFRVGVRTRTSNGVNNVWSTVDTSFTNLPTDNTWVRRSGYVTTNATAVEGLLFLGVPNAGRSGAVGCIIDLDDITIIDVTDAAAAQATADATSTALSSLTSTVTQQGTTLTSQGTSITTLDNKITGMRTLSDNVLMNSNFAAQLEWWSITLGNAANSVVWGATSGDGGPGVVMNRAVSGNAVSIQTSGSGGGTQGWIPAAPGAVFRVTVRGKKLSGSGNFLLRLFRKLQNGTTSGYSDTYIPNGGFTDTFADYNVDLPAVPANTTGVYLAVFVHTAVGSVALDRLEMRNVTVDLAQTATAGAVTALTNRVTATEGSITSQSTQLTSLSNSLNAASANGKNLITNGSFEFGGTVGWVNPANVTFVSEGVNGSLCLKRVGAAGAGAIGANSNGAVPVTPGQVYRISCNYKTDAAYNGTAGNGKLRLADQNGGLINTSPATPFLANKTAWTRLEGVFTVPPGNVNGLRLTISMDNTAGTLWVDDVWLEEVGAELASSSAITTLQSTVNAQGGTISAQASQITSLTSSVAGKADASVVVSMQTQVNNQGFGGNLIPNSTFPNWSGVGWSQPGNDWLAYGDQAGTGYQPYGIATALATAKRGTVAANDNQFSIMSPAVPVVVGKTYCLAFGGNVHRGAFLLYAEFKNAAGQILGSMAPAEIVSTNRTAGPLAEFPRYFAIAKAPAGATTVTIAIRYRGTGEADPYVWIWQPMFCEVAEGANQPPPYSPGGSEANSQWAVDVRADGKIAGLRLANDGRTSVFDIVADKFRISGSGGNARTEYSDNNWRVYDANGTLRVRMGVW